MVAAGIGCVLFNSFRTVAGSGNFVGQIKTSNLSLLKESLNQGIIPVITSIAPDEDGQAYNINADTMAAEIAKGLAADKLLLMTDTPGILRDINAPDSLITGLDLNKAQALIDEAIVQDGMIPKLECCIDAVKSGVSKAIILNGLDKHSILLETFTDQGAGTLISQ